MRLVEVHMKMVTSAVARIRVGVRSTDVVPRRSIYSPVPQGSTCSSLGLPR